MRVTDVRRRNLLILRERFRSDCDLARAMETKSSDIRQLLRDPQGRRKIGDKSAPKVESRFGLPDGWMDGDHDAVAQAAASATNPAPGVRVAIQDIALAVDSGAVEGDVVVMLGDLVRKIARGQA